MKKKPQVKNPIAKQLRQIRHNIVASKKGKGSYNRKRLAKWAQVTS